MRNTQMPIAPITKVKMINKEKLKLQDKAESKYIKLAIDRDGNTCLIVFNSSNNYSYTIIALETGNVWTTDSFGDLIDEGDLQISLSPFEVEINILD